MTSRDCEIIVSGKNLHFEKGIIIDEGNYCCFSYGVSTNMYSIHVSDRKQHKIWISENTSFRPSFKNGPLATFEKS